MCSLLDTMRKRSGRSSEDLGVSKVLLADAPQLADGLAEDVATVMTVANGYSHIVAPATAYGKNIAPRIAAKLDARSPRSRQVSADTFERPIYAGNAIATVQSAIRIKVITCADRVSIRWQRKAAAPVERSKRRPMPASRSS